MSASGGAHVRLVFQSKHVQSEQPFFAHGSGCRHVGCFWISRISGFGYQCVHVRGEVGNARLSRFGFCVSCSGFRVSRCGYQGVDARGEGGIERRRVRQLPRHRQRRPARVPVNSLHIMPLRTLNARNGLNAKPNLGCNLEGDGTQLACQRRAAAPPGRFSPPSRFLFFNQAQASPATVTAALCHFRSRSLTLSHTLKHTHTHTHTHTNTHTHTHT